MFGRERERKGVAGFFADDEAAHRAGVFHRAAVEDRHGVAEFGKLTQDVRADEDRFSQPLQLLQNFHQLNARARVEPARGFVEQKQVGIMHEHACERDALLHASREALHEVVLPPRHVGECEDVGDGLVALRLAHAVRRAEKIEVLEDGHLAVH